MSSKNYLSVAHLDDFLMVRAERAAREIKTLMGCESLSPMDRDTLESRIQELAGFASQQHDPALASLANCLLIDISREFRRLKKRKPLVKAALKN